MSDAPEDFERLLERCRAQLNAINLSLPILEEEGGPNALPPPTPAPAPRALPAPVAASVAVAERRPAPVPKAEPPPKPAPVAEPLPPLPPEPAVLLHKSVSAPAPAPEPELLPPEPAPAPAAVEARTFTLDDLPARPHVSTSIPPAPAPAPVPEAEPEPERREREDHRPVEPLRRTSLDLPAAPIAESADVEEALPAPPVRPVRADKPAPFARPFPARPARVPAESPFGWGAVVLAGAVAAAVFGVWRLQRPAADRSFPLEAGTAVTLRPERSDLLVSAGSKLLDVTSTGRVVERRDLGPAASLSWNQGALWTVDGVSRAVVERRDAAGHATAFTLPYVPRAVYSRGRDLWTLEGDRTIRQYLVSRSLVGVQLQPLDLFQLSDLAADAIAVDDSDVLWVFDRTTRRLCRLHKVGPALRPIDSAPLTPWIGSADVRSLALDETSAWLLVGDGNGRAAVHRILIGRLDWSGS